MLNIHFPLVPCKANAAVTRMCHLNVVEGLNSMVRFGQLAGVGQLPGGRSRIRKITNCAEGCSMKSSLILFDD